MRVKLLHIAAGPTFAGKRGDLITVDAATAKLLVDARAAEVVIEEITTIDPVDEPEPETTYSPPVGETTVKPKPKPRTRRKKK